MAGVVLAFLKDRGVNAVLLDEGASAWTAVRGLVPIRLAVPDDQARAAARILELSEEEVDGGREGVTEDGEQAGGEARGYGVEKMSSPRDIDSGEREVVTFRALVIGSLVIYAFALVLPWIEGRWIAPEVWELLAQNSLGAVAPIPVSIWWIAALSFFPAGLGLFHFSKEARLVYTCLVAFWLFWTPFQGVAIFSSVGFFLHTLLLLLDGAILALSYTPPLKGRFELRRGEGHRRRLQSP